MHNLLRCRRGSAAFATVAALIPLIGVVALGAEAGSWYVTKQHAQNAADAAAYSGGLACANSGSCTTPIAQAAGQPIALKNGFLNTAPQAVIIDVLSSWNGNTGTFVRAQVSQTQPVYLATVLGVSSPVSIRAQAAAIIDVVTKPPCILALNGSVSFQGSPTLSSTTCGVASNSKASNAIDFTGNGGLNIGAPTFAVGGCSQTGGSQCDNVITYAPPVPNPLSGLDSAMASLNPSDFSGGKCGSLSAYGTGSCYNDGLTLNSGSLTLNGTYFINGDVKITGGTITAGPDGATLVLFGGATLKISGSPTIQLTAQTNPQVPPALSAVSGLMKGLLIYDSEVPKNENDVVKVTGGPDSFFNGTVYVPNSPVEYSGNSSASAPDPGCFQVIAYAVTFSGNTELDNSKCESLGASVLKAQYVRLVP